MTEALSSDCFVSYPGHSYFDCNLNNIFQVILHFFKLNFFLFANNHYEEEEEEEEVCFAIVSFHFMAYQLL